MQECVQLARLRHHLPAEAVQFTRRRSAMPTVSGDMEELKAAISNLLDNAVKYSGQRVRIMVELVQNEASRLAVRVKDEGAGIPPSELKRIFKRFYRIPEHDGASRQRVPDSVCSSCAPWPSGTAGEPGRKAKARTAGVRSPWSFLPAAHEPHPDR